ncbi:hypothetical protein [Ammoniphilus sp. 3BR4]|uniref:hypothetical protein n=1 Tax=Ammoniphilus sp. 3BR4 TaxID=3158265 RepID=UPI0034671D46
MFISAIAALQFTVLLMLLMFTIVKLLKQEPLAIREADLRRFRRLEKEANRKKEKT